MNHPNLSVNLLLLKKATVNAIKEFEKYHILHAELGINDELKMLAAHSCAMTEAYAIMTGTGYDEAAEILQREAHER